MSNAPDMLPIRVPENYSAGLAAHDSFDAILGELADVQNEAKKGVRDAKRSARFARFRIFAAGAASLLSGGAAGVAGVDSGVQPTLRWLLVILVAIAGAAAGGFAATRPAAEEAAARAAEVEYQSLMEDTRVFRGVELPDLIAQVAGRGTATARLGTLRVRLDSIRRRDAEETARIARNTPGTPAPGH